MAQAAHDIKAEDVVVLDLRKLATFSDYFVIASGRSDRQVQAISDNIQDELKKKGLNPISIEGYQTGHWVLIDYANVVAHIFYQETREFYALDKLWGDAPRVKLQLK